MDERNEDDLPGYTVFHGHIFDIWMENLSWIISLHGLTRRSTRETLSFDVSNLARCDLDENKWRSCLHCLLKQHFGYLHGSYHKGSCGFMCLVYRVKQSKSRYYVSYSCFVVAISAVHLLQTHVRFICQWRNCWLNIFLKQWRYI